MKKKILAITTVIIVVLLVTSLFVYSKISELQSKISELQEQNSDLEGENEELKEQNGDFHSQIDELEDRLVELQNMIDIAKKVKIIDAAWIGGFNPIVGMTLAHPVNVTIQNTGVNYVSELVLTVKMVDIASQNEVGMGFVEHIDVIHAGETLGFSDYILATLGSISSGSADCVITLTLGDAVLDEWSIRPGTIY